MSGNPDELFLDHDTTEEDLAAQLPSFMPKDDASGNYKLLAGIAERVDFTKEDLVDINEAMTVQHANSIQELDRLGRLVDLPPQRDETLEHYRARLIAEFQLVTGEGTVKDLLIGAASILDTDIESIKYTEEHTSGAAHSQLEVPTSRLAELQFSNTEFASILNELVPASYVVSILQRGTFTYLSEADYSGSGSYNSADLNSDATLGHDGLDGSGDPKDNGGTYAGIVD